MKISANQTSLCIVLLIAASVLQAPCRAEDDPVLNLARFHFKKGEYRKAQKEFTEAINKDPHKSYIYQERAECFEKLGLNTESMSDYSAALKLAPKNGWLWLQYAHKMRQMESLDAAARAFEKAIALHCGEEGSAYRDLAEVLSESGQRRESIAAYKQAYALLKNQDDRFDILRRTSENYLALKQPQEALAELNKAIAMCPNEERPYRGRARIYSELKEYDKAIADISRSMKCHLNKEQMAGALRMRARFYEMSGQTEKAIEDLTQLFKLFPRRTRALFDRATLYDKINKHDLANKDRAQVREIDAHGGDVKWGKF